MEPIPLSSGSNTSWALPLAKQNKWILIDAGAEIDNPKPSYSWDLMQAALLNENIAPKDIELVLITHEHIDHAGLAYRWAASGTTILAHPLSLQNPNFRKTRLVLLRRHPRKLLLCWHFFSF